jgi:hypothetical protein
LLNDSGREADKQVNHLKDGNSDKGDISVIMVTGLGLLFGAVYILHIVGLVLTQSRRSILELYRCILLPKPLVRVLITYPKVSIDKG